MAADPLKPETGLLVKLGSAVRHADGEFIRYEDHRAAFQDREAELEKEREEVERVRKHHADDVAVAAKRIEGLEARANRAEAALREAGPKIRAILSAETNYESAWCEATTQKIVAALDTSIEDREPEDQQQVEDEK